MQVQEISPREKSPLISTDVSGGYTLCFFPVLVILRSQPNSHDIFKTGRTCRFKLFPAP